MGIASTITRLFSFLPGNRIRSSEISAEFNQLVDQHNKLVTDTTTVATQSALGMMSSADKTKLDGVVAGAEVNQNAFSTVKVGETIITSDSKTDQLELEAGNQATLTVTGKKVRVDVQPIQGPTGPPGPPGLPGGLQISSTRAMVIAEDFYNINSLCPGLTGGALSSGTAAAVLGTKQHPGIISLSDSSTAYGGYVIKTDGPPGLPFLIGGGERAEFIFQSKGERSGAQFRMGFQNLFSFMSMLTNGVFFEVSSQANQRLYGRCVRNSLWSNTPTYYTLTVNTWYRGTIEVNADATMATFTLFSEDGTQLWQGTISSNIPIETGYEVAFGVTAGENSTGAGAVILWLDYVSMSVERTLTR